MKATIVRVTPEVAQNYLKNGGKNRKVDDDKVLFYTAMMENGEWKENGEAIIFDKMGSLKDGQHRCHAIIKSNHSFWIPIITDVACDVMATIDTGKNRSLSDILTINGFKNTSTLSAVIIMILKRGDGLRFVNAQRSKTGVSNSFALDYCIKNEDALVRLVKESISLNKAQPYSVLGVSKIAYGLYRIGGYDFTDVHINFIKHVLGNMHNDGNAAQYLHKKLYNSRINKEPLNWTWVMAIFIKAWNLFIEGDPAVKYLQYDLKNPFPKVKIQ